MTQDELDHLEELSSFPTGVQTSLRKVGETIMLAYLGEVAFYEATLHLGLVFQLTPPLEYLGLLQSIFYPTRSQCMVEYGVCIVAMTI